MPLEVGGAWGVPELAELAGDVGGGEGVDVGGVRAEVVGWAAVSGDQNGCTAGGRFEGDEPGAFVEAGQTEDPAGEVEGGPLFGSEFAQDDELGRRVSFRQVTGVAGVRAREDEGDAGVCGGSDESGGVLPGLAEAAEVEGEGFRHAEGLSDGVSGVHRQGRGRVHTVGDETDFARGHAEAGAEDADFVAIAGDHGVGEEALATEDALGGEQAVAHAAGPREQAVERHGGVGVEKRGEDELPHLGQAPEADRVGDAAFHDVKDVETLEFWRVPGAELVDGVAELAEGADLVLYLHQSAVVAVTDRGARG